MKSRESSSSQNGGHQQIDELTHSGNDTVTWYDMCNIRLHVTTKYEHNSIP